MDATTTSSIMPRARILGAYLQEARCEVLRYLRNPGFLLPIILFPNVFYVMFGILLNHGDGEAARYMLASYSTFGVMAPGLFGFGVSLALERFACEGGQLRMRIVDDGRGGIDAEGNGLAGMRERVRALGGSLAIASPRGGTTLEIMVPLPALERSA